MSDKHLRIRVLLDAMDRISAPMRKIAGGTGKASAKLKEARERLKELERVQKDVAAFRGLKASLDDTTAALADQQRKAQELGARYRALEAPTRKQTREFEKQKAAVVALKAKQQDEARQLQELRGRLQAAGLAGANMAQGERRLRGEIARTTAEIEQQQSRLKKLSAQRDRVGRAKAGLGVARGRAGALAGGGAGAIGAGAAVGAVDILAVREAITFEDAMADVRKVVNFPTPKAFAEMKRDILDLSEVLPVTADELGAITAAAGQAGIARQDLKAFAGDAAKMAIAFDTEGGVAGEMMAKWRTAFRLTQPEVVGLADRINYLSNNGPATALAISDVVTRIGALGEVAGVSSAQVAAMGSTIVGMGVETEIAATGIKNTMLALTKGGAATNAQKQAFEALGLSATDVAKRMQKDAGGTIIDVLKRIQGLSKDQQASVLTQLFGSESVAAIAPLLTNLGLLETNLKAVGDASLYSGSMQKEFESRSATTSNELRLMANSAQALGIEFGTTLLPQIREVSGWLRSAAKGVRKWADENPKLASTLAAITAGVAIVLVALGGIAVAIGAVLAPFAMLNLAWVNALPLLAPLANGLLLLGKGFLAFGAAAARAGVMLLFNPITWIVLAIVAAVALLAAGAWLIVKNWGPISAWFGRLWQGIMAWASKAFEFLKFVFLNFTPLGLLIKVFAAVWPWLSSMGAKFAQLGGHLIMGLVKGITDKLGAIKGAIVGAAKAAIGWFKSALGIKSPSRVFAGLGDYTMQGLAVGLKKGERGPLEQIRSSAGKITRAMAVGATIAAGAGAMPAAASGGGGGPVSGTARSGGDTYIAHIHAAPGMDEKALFALFEAWVARREAKKAAAGRSALADYDD